MNDKERRLRKEVICLLRLSHSRGDVIKGQYEVLEKIKTGGMSSVYKVLDMKIKTCYACKEMDIVELPGANSPDRDKLLEIFAFEGHAAASLRHPGIPRAFYIEEAAGECPGADKRCYLMFEYINGKDLEEMLAQRSAPFDESELLPWLLQIAGVIAYMHGRNVFHRDIKPDNIIIEDSTAQAFLADFGIADMRGSDFENYLTGSSPANSLKGWGTRGYTPGDGRVREGRARDIYAFGMTAYRLVSGLDPRKPYELLKMKSESPSGINHTISRLLEQFILKATGRTGQFYTDAGQVVDDLKKIPGACGKRLKADAIPLKIACCGRYFNIDEKTVRIDYLREDGGCELEFLKFPPESFMDEVAERHSSEMPFDIVLCSTCSGMLKMLEEKGVLLEKREMDCAGICRNSRKVCQAQHFLKFFKFYINSVLYKAASI